MKYIVRQDKQHQQRIRALMDYFFEVGYRYAKYGCLKTAKPAHFTAVSIGGIKKILDCEVKIKAKQRKEPMAYLWFIGISPLFTRGRATGSKLLKQVIVGAKQQGLQVYFETSTDHNRLWYNSTAFVNMTKWCLAIICIL